MKIEKRLFALAVFCVSFVASSAAQSDPAAPATPRIYIFDNGEIRAGATWIVQQAERDYMFGEAPQGVIRVDTYDQLRNAKTILLDNADHDVFGDGSVVVMATPGHTPGHQVLAVKLANAGTILLGGDLYHYPEERTTGRIPTFEFDAGKSRASRDRVEAFLKETGAALWIEHDIATHAALPKSPDYVD